MGSLTLPPSGSVYIDANTAIYAVEKIEPYHTFLAPLWPAAQSGQLSLVTSELTWLETPDALHAATALAANCALFLTNDTAFQRVPGLRVTILSVAINA